MTSITTNAIENLEFYTLDGPTNKVFPRNFFKSVELEISARKKTRVTLIMTP